MHEDERDYKDPMVEDSYAQDPLFPTPGWQKGQSYNAKSSGYRAPYVGKHAKPNLDTSMSDYRQSQILREQMKADIHAAVVEVVTDVMQEMYQRIMDRIDELEDSIGGRSAA